MRRLQFAALGLVLLVLAGSPLVVSASSTPDFEVYVPENIVEPGEETDLELEIRNAASAEEEDDTDAGEIPRTEARDVTVSLDADGAPIDVKTDESPQPTMSAQTLLSESFTIAVDEDAEAGTYELTAEIEYTYTHSTSSGSERTDTDEVTFEVVVEEQARFEASGVESDLVVGDRGIVELDLTNIGVENASDAVVRFDSPDENVAPVQETVDDSEIQTDGSEQYVGEWGEGQTETVTAAMELDDDAVARTYPVSVTVEFRDDRGVDQLSREVRVGAPASDAQSFGFQNVTGDLHVGADGTVRGEVTNDGPYPVDNAVLTISDGEGTEFVPEFEDGLGSASNVYPRETQYAVGDLKPGEAAPFEFRFGIGSEAEPGPRVVEADVRYRNVHDDVRMTNDPVDLEIDVGPERDEFELEAINASYEVGETRTIELEVTNRKDETLTDVEAKLFTNDPLDSDDDEGFVPELAPGETATVAFEVSVADDATPQTYPLRLDFRYDDERSNSQLTDTYRVPIEVSEPDDDGLSALWIGVGAGLLIVLGAVWWFRARLEPYLEGVPYVERLPHAESPSWVDRLPLVGGSTGSDPGAGDALGDDVRDAEATYDERDVPPAEAVDPVDGSSGSAGESDAADDGRPSDRVERPRDD